MAPQTTGAPTSHPSLEPSTPVTGTPVAVSAAGPPTNEQRISNPKFSVSTIERSSPAQVAWAYLTLRLSYSYTDNGPGEGVRRAAAFATATKADALTKGLQRADRSSWQIAVAEHAAAAVIITNLTTFTPNRRDGFATVVASWNLTLTGTSAGSRTQGGLHTTLTLNHGADGWAVSDDGLGQPN